MTHTRNLMGAALFAALMIVSSYVTIPIGPVPITLQTFMAMLAGFLLGPAWGTVSVFVWLLLGCLGLPVFNQGQSGIVMLAGKISYGKSGDSLLKNFVYLALTMVVCYAVGALGFKLSFAYFLHKPMTWDKTLALAVLPFLPLDILKSFLVAFLGIRIRRALKAGGLWKA